MQRTIKAIAAGTLAAIFLAFSFPVSAATYQGIDVSKWEPNYDFSEAKADGAQVAYLRSSLAENTKDTSFNRHYEEAKKAGLFVGAYHFFYDGGGYTVDKNVENAVEAVQGKTFDCKYVIDMEGEGLRANLSKEQLTADVLQFADEFTKQTGIPCALYASTYFVKEHFTSDISKLPIWIADYRGKESGLSENTIYTSYAGWQYADDGKFGNCLVDADYFYDSMFIGKAPDTSPQPIQQPAAPSFAHHIGEQVTFSYCFASSTDAAGKAIPAGKMYVTHGTITRILSGVNNPYLLDSGLCWVNDSAISGASAPAGTSESSSTAAHSVGEEVAFTTCYRSSTDPISEAIPASRMSVHHGKITKIIPGRHNPYLLDDGLCWVNDGDISGFQTTSQSSGISNGSVVSIRSGATYGGLSNDRGKSVPSFALSGKYTIEQIVKHYGVNEALLSSIDSWVAVSKLYRR